jgi:hypothetical protein
MTTVKWEAKAGVESVLTTELNSLADDGNKITTSALSNDASNELYLYADFKLYLAEQGSARDSGGGVALYILPEVDSDHNYGSDSLDPPVQHRVGFFEFDAAVTARESIIRGVLLPPSDFHVLVINETGQAFAASGNTLDMERYNMQATA